LVPYEDATLTGIVGAGIVLDASEFITPFDLSWTTSFSNASHPALNYKIYLSYENGSDVITTPDATPA